jgi:cytidylate kinase
LESRVLEADSRDEEDRARLHDVYGFDYGAAVPSDAALDTSSLSTRETAEAIWKLLQGTIQ